MPHARIGLNVNHTGPERNLSDLSLDLEDEDLTSSPG